MLYVSTRNPVDSFTAYRALREEYTPDGGMFVPMRFPVLPEAELERIQKGSFGETVAYILNLFFSTDLTGWDIDSCAGRHPYKLVYMSHKLLISELWHNQKFDYHYLQSRIYQKLLTDGEAFSKPTPWAKIAIGIAVLCGVWGEVNASQSDAVDVAVTVSDFSQPLSVYYAKKMGIPIGNIIFACEDDGTLWDLFNHAEASCVEGTIGSVVEQIIFDKFGLKESITLIDACSKNKNYRLSDENVALLRENMYVSVIGAKRIDSLFSSIYRSCGYVADKNVALSFGGLQNYRAQTGCSKPTLLLELHSPAQYEPRIHTLLGISKDELLNQVKNT